MSRLRATMTKRASRLVTATLLAVLTASWGWTVPAGADSYVPISGAGSTWSQNALQTWISAVSQYGERVNYAGTGSSDGRNQFRNGTVDFAASDIPFQAHPTDGSQPENVPAGSYAYVPITAGGTVFMYNLTIAGHRVTNLRLSGQNISKIFTGAIKTWNDAAIQADNPGLVMPATTIVPVVRSDGSGSTAQFTTWMINQYPNIWNSYCQTSGRAPTCGLTSNYPTIGGMIAQSGDIGVAGYVSQGFANGAIGYVNYSYAIQAHFPVAQMLNAAGYYTEPTPQNVAVSLLAAQVDTTDVNDPTLYLTQKLDGVYTDQDPRSYPLSSYSYLIIPTKEQGQFNAAKGKTLAAFSYYAMCQGQQSMANLGYSPMPVNLVQDTFTQIAKIPGAVVQNITIQQCNNPTFDASGKNLLAVTDPLPPACAKRGPLQCSSGTGGAAAVATPVKPAAASGGSGGSASGAVGAGADGKAGSGASSSVSGSSSAAGGSGPAAGLAAGSSASAASGSAAAGASASCDPTAGNCQTAGGTNADTNVAATPYTIAAKKGWGGNQTLMLIAGLIVLAIVFAPGLSSRYFRRLR